MRPPGERDHLLFWKGRADEEIRETHVLLTLQITREEPEHDVPMRSPELQLRHLTFYCKGSAAFVNIKPPRITTIANNERVGKQQ